MGAVLAATIAACGGAPTDLPTVDGRAIHPSVVEYLAARDGLDAATARDRVVDTLRLVAASREATGGVEPLAAARREHLRRGALARLLLHTEFEPDHRPQDIGADDPMLRRAHSEGRYVHPRLHHVCQLIAEPAGAADDAARERLRTDPTWIARASARMAEVRRHLELAVPVDDPEACALMQRNLPLEGSAETPLDGAADGVAVRSERAGGFDLEACAVAPAADGTCAEPRFAPEWVAAVRDGPLPGFRGPFTSRFGVHVVLVREVLPGNMPGDEGFEARLREAIHPAWRAAAMAEWMKALRLRHAALVAKGDE